MRNNEFVPADFTVHVGDTIHWVTEDIQAHNVVSNSATDPFRSPDVSTVPVPPGRSAEYSHTFAKEGTVDYLCEYHSGMVGTVTVVPANQTIA
ncbi:MAG: plastocyanin/azurin family copper-binding protein [Candidatus Thermoplasmatota archaeon]